MVVLLIVLAIITFWKIKVNRLSFYEDYLGTEQTTAVKGIFAVLILFSHMSSYLGQVSGWMGTTYEYIMAYLGQLIVVMFLFYSGFGINESLRTKDNYLKNFPKKRILKTLIHFDIAVLMFVIVDIALGIWYSPVNYLLCWIGFKDIGNSKWFVFDILIMYCIVYFVSSLLTRFRINPLKQEKIRISTIFLCSNLFIMIMYCVKQGEGSYWYNTLLSFPFGMLYSFVKYRKVFRMTNLKWGCVLGLEIISFFVLHKFSSFMIYNVNACLFAMIIVLFTMKIKLQNPILIWLGKKSFSIYIIQRLPMIILSSMGVQNQMMFVLISIPSVLIMAGLFDKILYQTDIKIGF